MNAPLPEVGIVLDYNHEADQYDATRGGEQRAAAAATAIEKLLAPTASAAPAAQTVLDVACGTGIVTRRLQRPNRRVLGVDRSSGMLHRAAQRLPGSVVLADASHLPIRTSSVDAVVIIWLLHLLNSGPDVEAVLAEAARHCGPAAL